MVGASRGLEVSEGEADGGEADGEEVEDDMMDACVRLAKMVRGCENCKKS
jgi:hypothetical protein